MTEHENRKLVCGVYTRVSSTDQVENGYSLEEQKEILLQRAAKQTLLLQKVYTSRLFLKNYLKEQKLYAWLKVVRVLVNMSA